MEKNLDDSESPKEKMLSEIALLGPLYSQLVDSLADSLGGLVEKQASAEAAAEERSAIIDNNGHISWPLSITLWSMNAATASIKL